MDRQRGDAHRHRPLAPEEGRGVRHTQRVIARLRKPHGQQGEVAIFPLIDNPGALLVPKARMFVLDDTRKVLAGPLVLARRRAYHREWLLSFEGVTTRQAVDGWRAQYLAVEADEAADVND